MPDEVPSTSEVVPAGLTQVVLAALFIPISLATLEFSLLTISAALGISIFNTFFDAMPVIDTPTKASLSVVSCHISLR